MRISGGTTAGNWEMGSDIMDTGADQHHEDGDDHGDDRPVDEKAIHQRLLERCGLDG